MVFPIIGKWFIESGILLFCNGLRFSHPNRFVFVLNFEFSVNFFDFFFLFVLWFFVFLLFDLDFFALFLLRLFFIIGNFFFSSFFNLKLDFEIYEFRVFFDQIFEFLFFQKFKIVWFQSEYNSRSSYKIRIFWGNCKCASSGGLPSVRLLLITRSWNHCDLVSDQIGRVEPYSELSDHRNISTRLKRLHECLCSWSSNRSQIVNHFLLCHPDTGIL